MRKLDDFLGKIGHDKFMHHILGALICALVCIVAMLQNGDVGLWAMSLGLIAVFILSVVKEHFDEYFDWMDIAWAMAGTIWVYSAIFIGILFNYLSN